MVRVQPTMKTIDISVFTLLAVGLGGADGRETDVPQAALNL